MDKHRIAIRRSAENVWLNLFQSLLTFTIFLTIWVGIYQLITNFIRLFTAKNKKVRLLLVIYWLFIFLLILTWLYSESIFGFPLVLFHYLILGILLSLYSCFIRFVEYKGVKKENLPFVIPYTHKEECYNNMTDKRQIYYGHVVITLLGITVYLAFICIAYLLIMDALLYKKTESLDTKKHLRSLIYLSVFLTILGYTLSYLPMVENYLFIVVAIVVGIVGVYSTWIRYREYQHSKKRFNSLF